MAITTKKVLTLKESAAGAAITDLLLSTGVAQYSEAILIEHSVGYASLLITENRAGGAGDVDIYAEYSMDGTNWYRPYISDMAGVITIEGNIVTTLQNVTRWIVFTLRMAKYMRFCFDPDANSTITAKLVFELES